MAPPPKILIAGGGIGGLTLALMLHARDIPCQVFEAAAENRPVGGGINALPHSIGELQALGLLPELDRIGIRTRQLTYANQWGQPIWSEPRGLHAGHRAPQFSLNRGLLQTMLWQAATQRLPAGAVRAGWRLAGYEQNTDGVTARFKHPDGSVTSAHGAALVGADGIHSTLRAKLHPQDGGMRWNGITMWRGAVDWPSFDGGDRMVIAGDATAKLVLYPIGPGATPEHRLTNWVIYARTAPQGAAMPAPESWSRTANFDHFRAFAARIQLPFIDTAAIIQTTSAIYEYPMCDRDPLPWWTQGRVTLLGDAAHPMYPVGSNGASQAILDARCLADALVQDAVPAALAAYEAARRPATADIVHSNRVGGPERVVDLVAARAPAGFAQISDVATEAELAGIVRGYAQLAGFAVKA